MKYIIIFIIALTLSSCDQICVDADDFGFAKVTISSRPSSTLKLYGQNEDQVIEWTNSGYQITGERLSIMVRNGNNSRWSPWYSSDSDLTNIPYVTRSSPVCLPTNNDWNYNPSSYYITLSNVSPNISNDSNGNNACYFNKGVGLYGLITAQDPNLDEKTIRVLPSDATSFHLGDNLNLFQDTMIGDSIPTKDSDESYQGTGGYNDSPPSKSITDGKLYFKILDHYYEDNGGQYRIIMKSGVKLPGLSIIGRVIKYTQEKFNDASSSLYDSIIANGNFTKNVKVLLTLYIIIQAISFIFGITQMSQSQFALHIFKIAIIMQLIATDTSWNFFNNTLFKFFTQGVTEMICIVSSASGASSGSSCSVETMFDAFDDSLNIFLSWETWYKACSLIFHEIEGILLVLALCIAAVLFILALFKAVVFFLVAYLATSLLIVLSPIFIPFILFKITSGLFNNLINQLLVYFIQPVIIFAGLSFWSNIIVTQLQKLLGFKICYGLLWGLFPAFMPSHVHVNPASDLQWIYAPGIYSPLDRNKTCSAAGTDINNCNSNNTNQSVNNYYINSLKNDTNINNFSNLQSDSICTPYKCLDLRFPDLPFLQPYILDDHHRIEQIASGNYVSMSDIIIFIVLIYLMYLFNNVVPEIAKGISGEGGYTTISEAASHANNAIDKFREKYIDDNLIKLGGTIVTKIPVLNKARDIINGGRELAGSGLEKVGKYVDYTINPVSSIAERITRTDENAPKFVDKIGGYIDSRKELASAIKQQALYDSSFKLLGNDMKSKIENNGKSAMDNVLDRYSYQNKLSENKTNDLKRTVDNLTKSGKTLNRWTKAALIASAVNPIFGLAIGAIGLAKTARTGIPAIRELNDL